MAGGTWTSQNKVRPGAYINFKAVQRSALTVGDRGVAAIGLPLSWGEEGELIDVLSSDFLNGNSLKTVGIDASSTGRSARLLRGILSYAYDVLVYRLPTVGTNAVTATKATATAAGIVFTAKYKGAMGNNLSVAIVADGTGWRVYSYLNGVQVDNQKISTISDLVSNDYIDFSAAGSGSLAATTATLTGGLDEVVTSANIGTAYTAMRGKLELANWQTLAVATDNATEISNFITFIENLREDEGRYVQAVVANASGADYEGIINNVCGAIVNGETFDAVDFTAIVAGMTAGANFNESNTARVIVGATSIVNQLTDSQIKAGLGEGKFMLSSTASGNIKVEQDINSLHNYPSDKNYAFSKNRVIRLLDEIGTSIKQTWEDVYMGKVNNNAGGRSLFRADIIQYINELQRLTAVQDFSPEDVVVEQGTDIDAVLVTIGIMPVDSMEKLYMTVNVSS